MSQFLGRFRISIKLQAGFGLVMLLFVAVIVNELIAGAQMTQIRSLQG